MRTAAAGVVAALMISSAQAADNTPIERLATCQDSWFEWQKNDPPRLQAFVAAFKAGFERKANDAFFVPKSPQSLAGLPIAQAFPQSVGMGVGFSVVVDAGFDKTKAAVEKKIGRPISHCEPPSDNMRTCELQLGDKKTVTLLAEDKPTATRTLVGCYYFYEK